MKSQTKKIIAIGITLCVIFVLYYTFTHKRPLASSIALGNPCSTKDIQSDLNTHGLQCYFYGDVDQKTGSRPGKWVLPTIDVSGVYTNYTSEEWKTYATPDNKITLQYPTSWSLNTANWENSKLIAFTSAKTPVFFIGEISKTSRDIREIVQSMKENKTAVENDFILNGSQVIRLDIAGENNLEGDQIIFLIDKEKYYIQAEATKFSESSDYNFPIEYVFSTLKVVE